MTATRSTRLSATDAFFVAYQESSGVLMQLGAEVDLKGRITRSDVEQMLDHIVRRWPPLGQRLRRNFFGLSWDGECRTSEMLNTAAGLSEWRNRPIDPFAEPPFQLLWIARGDNNVLAFRAHHAVVDGEGFFAVCGEALRTLVHLGTTDFIDDHRTSRKISVTQAFRNLQQLRRTKPGARIAMRSCSPGETSVVERDVSGVANGWLCASAWTRAIHAWNNSRGNAPTSLISIEVPVSLRRQRERGGVRIGNWISPITVTADASQTLEVLATDLKKQMRGAMRQRMHLALPKLSAPARFVPWRLFRKLAASPELTGYATSHFAWFEQSRAIHDDVFRGSNGALQMVDQQIYTPVCLHMGAAMAVLAWPDRTQMFITHRLTALTTDDANTLADLVVEELDQKYLKKRQQVEI
ncbi:MAG TPA: hypothetical protein VFZ22_13570 [Pyrinomonadaceae bacterium]|nr:hypothetical protein [Pyrinomonadaceae bacterium]